MAAESSSEKSTHDDDLPALDILIPSSCFSHQPTSWAAAPLKVVCVDYSNTRGCMTLAASPYVKSHVTEGLSTGNDDFFSAPLHQVETDDQRLNAKQGLMEALLGGAAGGGALMLGSERPLPSVAIGEEVRARLQGPRCDATHLGSPALMVALIRAVLMPRTDPSRPMMDCLTAIDMSHTQLGRVGPRGPQMRFDDAGNAMGGATAATRFYPDVCTSADATPAAVWRHAENRSLALTYIAPFLFIPGMRLYRITELTCTHCGLTDADAHALALIIRVGDGRRTGGLFRRSKTREKIGNGEGGGSLTMSCVLERLDISFNSITDVGMEEIRRSIKYNRHLKTIVLAGNRLEKKKKMIDAIERQLRRNREGQTSWAWYKPKHWMRRWKDA